MPSVDPHEFAAAWLEAWNAHDLDRVLAHYCEDAIVRSPLAAWRIPESGGIVRGHAALRTYWGSALGPGSELHFDLVEVLPTVDGVTILYRNHRGQRVAETVVWDRHGLVHTAVVAYSGRP